MDPITASVLNALFAGVLTGVTELGKAAMIAAYTKLKDLLKKKFGATSGVMRAVDELERYGDSPYRRWALQKEVAEVNAWQDAEVLAAARYLQTVVQQQQINLHKSTVQGSIIQVGHDQYQIGRDQYNVDAGKLVGPGAKRGARNIISVLLIIGGLLMSIPAAGMLPFFNAIVDGMGQNQPSGPDGTSFTATANSFGISVHVMIFTIIGLGILMVIGGILLRRNFRKS